MHIAVVTLPLRWVQSIAVSVFVCLSACLLTYLKNMSMFY